MQTLYLQSGWLPLSTCTGGLVPSSTGIYTACADCNLHCDSSGVMEVVPWDGSMWWLYIILFAVARWLLCLLSDYKSATYSER